MSGASAFKTAGMQAGQDFKIEQWLPSSAGSICTVARAADHAVRQTPEIIQGVEFKDGIKQHQNAA